MLASVEEIRVAVGGEGVALALRIHAFGQPQAARHLARLKGQSWYDAVVQAAAGGPAMADPLAVRAEVLLCLYHALPLLNLRLDAAGGVEAARWTTLADGTRVQTTYASPETIRSLRADLLRQVDLLVDTGVREAAGEDEESEGRMTGI